MLATAGGGGGRTFIPSLHTRSGLSRTCFCTHEWKLTFSFLMSAVYSCSLDPLLPLLLPLLPPFRAGLTTELED